MGRRYLLRDEIEGVLRRGRTVECFLGACERDGKPGVRHVVLSMLDRAVAVRVYDSADRGSPEFLDIDEFGPLDPEVEHGDPDQVIEFASLEECLASMSQRWPGSSGRIVNEGVVQDEYADYVRGRSP